MILLFGCVCFGSTGTGEICQFTIFEDPNVHAAFPAIFQMKDRVVVSFMHQNLEALRKSNLHPHYAPAMKIYYGETTDFKQWKISENCPPLSGLSNITGASAAIDSDSFVNLVYRYVPGTKDFEPHDVRIFKKSYSASPIFAASMKELAGSGAHMHDVRKADDGGFLAAGYIAEVEKPTEITFQNAQQYLDNWPDGYRRLKCAFFKGSPDAKSWESLGEIPSITPYGLGEPSFAQFDNGRIVCLMRAQWTKKFKELFPDQCHFKVDYYGYFLCQSESNDGGKTWSAPKQLDIWGHPPYLLKLSSGNLLMVYGHRRPPYGVRSIISHDQGRSWDKSTAKKLYTFQTGGYDLGYPVAVQLQDGRIFCCFYGYTPATNKEKTAHGIYGCIFTE